MSLDTLVPTGSILSGLSEKISNLIFFLAIFFSCRSNETINFFSNELYRGTSRGFEVSLVDLMSLCLIPCIFFTKKNVKLLPPGTLLYLLYFIFSAISISNSANNLFSYFELWKMARMYLFFWVAFNFIEDIKSVEIFFKSTILILFYIFIIVLIDKYLGGRYQARGPFPHQNSLVMYLLLFLGPLISKVLNSKASLIEVLAAIFSSLGIIFTYSRAGLALYVLMIGGIYCLGLINKVEIKKLVTLVCMLLCGLIVLAKSIDTIIDRFENAPKESAETRIYMAKAAINMANDKIFGIGLNNWGIKVNKPYQYNSHSPRYHEEGFKEGLVETIYLMIAAETGWHNLVVFLLFIFSFLFRSIMLMVKNWKNNSVYIFIGTTMSLGVVYLESALEWVLKQTPNFYQLMLIFALIASIQKKNIFNKSIMEKVK